MLSGRKKKDYEAQQAADSLSAQASALGEAPAEEPIADDAGFEPADDDAEEGSPPTPLWQARRPNSAPPRGGGALPLRAVACPFSGNGSEGLDARPPPLGVRRDASRIPRCPRRCHDAEASALSPEDLL